MSKGALKAEGVDSSFRLGLWDCGASAKGAKYRSQGQALSKAKRVAPGKV